MLGFAADNTVGVLQQGDQAIRIRGEGDGSGGGVCGQDFIDAAAVEWSCEGAFFYLVLQVGGEIGFMLDNTAIHVYDVEGPIGSGVEVDRAKAFVFAGEKFLFFFCFPACCDIAGCGEKVSLNKVSSGFCHEGIAFIGFWEAVAGINDRATGGSKCS